MNWSKVGLGVAAAGVLFAGVRSCGAERRAVERVAVVEHDQWVEWSKSVAPEVTPDRRARWQKYWVPYEDLPEDVKELDRIWARKALAAANR
jgi:hypothetical protein